MHTTGLICSILAVFLCLNLLLGQAVVFASNHQSPALAAHEPGQALVKLKNSDKIYQLDLATDDLVDFIQTNQSNQSIEYVEPNYLYQATLDPNDPLYTQQLHLASIGAPAAWNLATGNNSVIIAIIDSGVAIDHPDLKNNLWYNLKEIPSNNIDDDANGYVDDYQGWDFLTNIPDPRPKFGSSYSFLGMNHGTIVAGVAAAQGNNGQGVSGVVWNAKIMPLRVLDANGAGNTLDVARAIDYAVDNGADMINLSFVGAGKSTALEQSIARAYTQGVLIIAAAGNEVDHGVNTTDDPKYPVCHDGGFGHNYVIGVASVDNFDQLASFSNFGKCIDIVAPGVGIFSTLLKDDAQAKFTREYGGYWSGTSVSAPQVAGVVALVKSLKPNLNLTEIASLLLDNADSLDQLNPLYAGKLGSGKLNAGKTVAAALSTVSQVEYQVDKIILGPGVGGGPHIRTYFEGKLFSQFFAFDENKRFGARVTSHDFDHDGQEEIIVSANQGEQPWIQIYDIYGNLQSEFLAFDSSMTQGINVAAADIDRDNSIEIIATAHQNFEPLVKIFDAAGNLKNQFLAFNPFFKGGLSLAVGDVNGDEFEEIIVSSGPGTSSLVKVFNYNGQAVSQFIAYDPSFMRGTTVATGDVDGDSIAEIITGTRSGGGPQVRVFDWQGRVKSQFFAYAEKFLGGVNLASGDLNGDGLSEIITGAGPGGGPHVRVFNSVGDVIWQFFAYHEKFAGGVSLASGK